MHTRASTTIDQMVSGTSGWACRRGRKADRPPRPAAARPTPRGRAAGRPIGGHDHRRHRVPDDGAAPDSSNETGRKPPMGSSPPASPTPARPSSSPASARPHALAAEQAGQHHADQGTPATADRSANSAVTLGVVEQSHGTAISMPRRREADAIAARPARNRHRAARTGAAPGHRARCAGTRARRRLHLTYRDPNQQVRDTPDSAHRREHRPAAPGHHPPSPSF